MDNNRTKRYLDQFVRINYLYKIIEKNQINYDYIIRARIDQYIDYNILNNTITSLNNNTSNIYPIISSCMDNFFIIGKTHFSFFEYLLNHIGTEGLNYKNINDKYILGPETQFLSLINSFFIKIYNFSHFKITFCIKIYDNNIVIYRSKNTNGICFSAYINEKEKLIGTKINKTNFLEFLLNDKHIIKIYDINQSNILKKYTIDDYPITFYAIVI